MTRLGARPSSPVLTQSLPGLLLAAKELANAMHMNTKQKTNWWIDLVLFAGFIVTFFMDLTGMELHQWIGILVGFRAAYHLLLQLIYMNRIFPGIECQQVAGTVQEYRFSEGFFDLDFILFFKKGDTGNIF